MTKRFLRAGALAIACLLAAAAAHAVRLDATGVGQALIYPYYTVRQVDNNAWELLLSVVNTRYKPKAVKVRVREALHGRVVEEFNLYLGPYDMWTGAVLPTSDGKATLYSFDRSCTDPAPDGHQFGPFDTGAFTGSAGDGASTGVDRTFEGWVEMIEMGTLAGSAAEIVNTQQTFNLQDCPALIGPGKPRVIESPEGGLTGGGYLINVTSGLSSPFKAVALADLTQSSFYSDVGQPGTDFDSPQVTPISVMTVPASMTSGFGSSPQGYLLRSVWNRGVDAVSAILMASAITNEYVLDGATASNDDWVMIFPTARFYVDATPAVAPFTTTFSTQGACEILAVSYYNREQAGPPACGCDGAGPLPAPPKACWSSNVIAWSNGYPYSAIDKTSRVFGSPLLAAHLNPPYSSDEPGTVISSNYQDGFAMIMLSPNGPGLTSLPTSTAIDLSTGNVISGAHQFKGLPTVGFSAWIFNDGVLDCGGKSCRSTFGMNMPHRSIRNVRRIP